MSDEMQAQGTPWTITDVEVVEGCLTVTTGNGQLAQGIAYVPGEAENWPEAVQAKHARLIAAAPKMKSRLRNLIHEASDAADILEGRGMTGAASDLRRCIRNSEHAIAKAEGRHE